MILILAKDLDFSTIFKCEERSGGIVVLVRKSYSNLAAFKQAEFRRDESDGTDDAVLNRVKG